jgi:hypothetical protein
MEGLYFEASATTPYHFLNQSELSKGPSRAQRDLRYGELDVDLGVQHLQLLGVKYYMAFSPEAVAQASVNRDLTEVATVDGLERHWHIYEVADAPLVEPVTSLPAVVTDIPKGGTACPIDPDTGQRGTGCSWQSMAEDWYLDPTQWGTLRAASGPPEWERIEHDDRPERRRVDAVEVSNVEEDEASISFDVSDVGTPVLVKSSYFPNWTASGADGPYRVAPNLMVVVPTDEHVELHYGRTPVEWLAWLVTFAGIAAAVLLWRRAALALPPVEDRGWRWRLRLERVDEPEAEHSSRPSA